MPGPEAQHSARGFYPREGRYAIAIAIIIIMIIIVIIIIITIA